VGVFGGERGREGGSRTGRIQSDVCFTAAERRTIPRRKKKKVRFMCEVLCGVWRRFWYIKVGDEDGEGGEKGVECS